MSPGPAAAQALAQAPEWAPPTIKGIFVNSHIRAVEKLHGARGRARLETLVGRPLDFGATEDVPVALEVRVIEAAVELMVEGPVEADDVPYEAGKLHYRNFKGTPWAKIIFGMFPRDFSFMILHSPVIAERVFKGVGFEAKEVAPRTIKLVMDNADYPLAHFKGFFQAWMEDYGLAGTVVGQAATPRRFEYVMSWR